MAEIRDVLDGERLPLERSLESTGNCPEILPPMKSKPPQDRGTGARPCSFDVGSVGGFQSGCWWSGSAAEAMLGAARWAAPRLFDASGDFSLWASPLVPSDGLTRLSEDA